MRGHETPYQQAGYSNTEHKIVLKKFQHNIGNLIETAAALLVASVSKSSSGRGELDTSQQIFKHSVVEYLIPLNKISTIFFKVLSNFFLFSLCFAGSVLFFAFSSLVFAKRCFASLSTLGMSYGK